MPQWRNWQTRNVQVVVWVSMYRFESCLGHIYISVNVDITAFRALDVHLLYIKALFFIYFPGIFQSDFLPCLYTHRPDKHILY